MIEIQKRQVARNRDEQLEVGSALCLILEPKSAQPIIVRIMEYRKRSHSLDFQSYYKKIRLDFNPNGKSMGSVTS